MGRSGHDLFVANLIDVLVAVLTTPPSSATRRRAGHRSLVADSTRVSDGAS